MNEPADIHERAKADARRLTSQQRLEGFQPEALHTYTLADGRPFYWVIRMRHPETGDKWIRPMMLVGAGAGGFVLGKPQAPAEGHPLYRLDTLVARHDESVWVVEGEKCADALHKLGLPATTSGSATSAEGADWSPLRGRKVVIWPDNDEPGKNYAAAVTEILRGLK